MSFEMIRPMLAALKFDPFKADFPYIAEPKIDGIRFLVSSEGVALSRTLKPLPNEYFQKFVKLLGSYAYGLDGEVTVGPTTAPDVYNITQSGIMSEAGTPDIQLTFFDCILPKIKPMTYFMRHQYVATTVNVYLRAINPPEIMKRIRVIPWLTVKNVGELIAYRDEQLALGYEGIILRKNAAPYKEGRSTLKQGALIKWKEWVDAEAEIIGFEELMHNENEQVKDNLGLSKRSSHLANQVPGDTLGAFKVRNDSLGGEFSIGSGQGLTHELRKKIWTSRNDYLGKYVKFKYFPIGVKDKPRQPIWLGFRDKIDM